jgi:ankyrin repeat protein
MRTCPQVQELLDRGADVEAQDKKKISALHFASGHGRLEVVRFLRSRGAELDVEDSGTAVLPPHCYSVSAAMSFIKVKLKGTCVVQEAGQQCTWR